MKNPKEAMCGGGRGIEGKVESYEEESKNFTRLKLL